MAEGHSHELSVVVVQTLGAVAIAGISSWITYVQTAKPPAIETTTSSAQPVAANQENLQLRKDLKEARDQLDSTRVNSSEITRVRNELDQAKKLIDNITISSGTYSYTNTFKQSDCLEQAKEARVKFGTRNDGEGETYIAFKIGTSVVLVGCPSYGNVFRIEVSGVDGDNSLSEVRKSIRKIMQ